MYEKMNHVSINYENSDYGITTRCSIKRKFKSVTELNYYIIQCIEQFQIESINDYSIHVYSSIDWIGLP